MTANESGNLMTRDINNIIKEYNKDKSPAQQFKPVESLLAPETIQMINDFNASSGGQKLHPFLTTLYVVVPKNEQKAWRTTYESLLDDTENKEEEGKQEPKTPHFLVPNSSVLLAQDNDSGLNSVVVFTKDIEEFKSACRSRRFTVRKNDPSTVINEEEKASLKKKSREKETNVNSLGSNEFWRCFSWMVTLKVYTVFCGIHFALWFTS